MARRDLRQALHELYDRKVEAQRPASAVALLRLSIVLLALVLYALYRW